MKYLYVTCSELAKLTGHNQFEPLSKTVNLFLNKFGLKSTYVPKSNIEDGLSSLSEEKLNNLKQELGKLMGRELSIPISYVEKEKEYLEECIKKYIVYPTQSSNLTEQQSKELLSSKVMNNGVLQDMSQFIEKDLRMRRGNIRESKNLNTLQTKQNIQVKERNSRMYTKELLRTDNYCVILRGKVDGVSGDTVVEAKNRRSRLFMTLKDYERVQLEAYMFLTGYPKSILTEHFNEESNQIEYSHDEQFWSDCISSVERFMDTHVAPNIE